jgi:D-alanine-D-alanine ligase
LVKRCIVLHQAVDSGAPPDEQEVLSTVASVVRALRVQGWHAETLVLTADLAAATAALSRDPPDLVFNLVDSLSGADALAVVAPALLQHLGLRFTGARLAAYALTADKVATRAALRAAGIAVPPAPGEGWRGRYIVKNSTAHSSAGISPHSVVPHADRVPKGHFAEAFIDGREINVSILHGQVLPIAELAFEDWPDDLPRVNDYEAKWDTASLAYARINRRFGLDEALSVRLGTIARECWRVLGLCGYARIDFRLDAEGVAYVIDVNTNPCLDEDAGFAAAAAQAGLTYEMMILRIAEGKEHAAIPSARCHARVAVAIREELRPGDDIGALCRATGFFTDAEVAIAEELAADRRARGTASDYRFVLADGACGLCGYACYGAIPGTASGWDLYWIVVHPEMHGHGVGRQLLDAVMSRVCAAGGVRLYAETSGKPLYAPTRAFYEGTGFTLQATLPDFYAPGDAKLTWARSLDAQARPRANANVKPASLAPTTDRKRRAVVRLRDSV